MSNERWWPTSHDDFARLAWACHWATYGSNVGSVWGLWRL